MPIKTFSWGGGDLKYWTLFEKGQTDFCNPEVCITNIAKQLSEEKPKINLDMAYDCWKAVVVLNKI